MGDVADMYKQRRSAAIWPGQEHRNQALVELIAAAGCVHFTLRPSEPLPSVDFLLADFSSTSDEDGQHLSEIDDYLGRFSARALIWTNMERLDAHYAALPIDRCTFLLDGDADAVPILTGFFRQDSDRGVRESERDTQFRALHRISDELADFARTLARMAEQDRAGDVRVGRPVSFRPADNTSTTAHNGDIVAASQIRGIIKRRRLRDAYFGKDLFADPAWDILLDLFAAEMEGGFVSVSSLCIAAAVPPTTALRWITAMTESGLLTRTLDPADARRVFIRLGNEAKANLRAYFATIGGQDLTI